jgi:Icc-related predicted phosphoesterase
LVVPDGDILIHSGDATMGGTVSEISEFNFWIGKLPHKHKLFVAGNHDWLCDTNKKLAKEMLFNVTYLEDEEVVIDGVRIYGSPYQPIFCDWAFNLSSEKLVEKWAMVPSGLDILVTHCPPFGMLDKTDDGDVVGCPDLWDCVKVVKPKFHVFGHIHEAYGCKLDQETGTTFINASICDSQYRPNNKPFFMDTEICLINVDT